MGQQVGSLGPQLPIGDVLAERPMVQAAPPLTARDFPNIVESLLKIQEQEYEHGSKYTQLILGLGYAAFFTVWSGTRDQLTKFQVVSSAGLMVLSLVAYVIFEVQQMILRTTRLRRFTEAITVDPGSIGSALQEFNKRQIKSYRKAMKFWSIFMRRSSQGPWQY